MLLPTQVCYMFHPQQESSSGETTQEFLHRKVTVKIQIRPISYICNYICRYTHCDIKDIIYCLRK